MNDINNNSGLTESGREQISNPNIHTENGSTYWESSELQNSFEEQIQQSYINNSDQNQNIQDLTYDELRGRQYELQQKKKSGKRPLTAAIISVILILLVAASAYAFSDAIRNTVSLLFKNPRDYYVEVENKSAKSLADKYSAYTNKRRADENTVQSLTATLSYDKDTVGALLQSYAGITISDLEAALGIPLDSIGFDMIASENSKGGYQKIGINLNSVDIITGELFTDFTLEQILIRIPELSHAYLKQSLDMKLDGNKGIDYSKLSDAIKRITSDSTGEFAKRYVKLITEEIEDVELKKKEPLSVGDMTVEANLLKVHFFPETMKNIMTKVLEEAKNDDYILDLLPLFEMSKEEYTDKIDYTIGDTRKSLDSLPQDKELMVMKVYVANDGSILGRKLDILDDNADISSMGFFYVMQNNKGAYDIYIDNDDDNNLKITGSHIKENGAYSGSLTFEASDVNRTTEFDVEYNDLKTETKNGKLYTHGSFSISSYAFMGMDLIFEFDVKDDAQLLTIKLNMGKSSLVTLETSTGYIEDYTIPAPDGNAEVYDIVNEIDDYYSTMDIKGFVSTLSDKLGIDLQDLTQYLMPSF